MAATAVAWRAERLCAFRSRPRVRVRNTGTLPGGSMTTKMVTNAWANRPTGLRPGRRGEPRRPAVAHGADPFAHIGAEEPEHLERERLPEARHGLAQPVVHD